MIRPLSLEDVPAALRLSTAAGWNQTAADWRLLIDLEPEGCFGIFQDEELIATTTLTCYGTDLAWIGMVLTHEAYRRQGHARRLVAHALEAADQRNVRTVKLDATELGRDLYRDLGFQDEQAAYRRHSCLPGRDSSRPVRRGRKALDEKAQSLDAKAFGANRTRLLTQLARAERTLCTDSAYLLHRPGRIAHYLGPCVAETQRAARDLLIAFLEHAPAQQIYWDILENNHEALALAEEFGFTEQRKLMRMYRGAKLESQDNLIYGVAGYELG